MNPSVLSSTELQKNFIYNDLIVYGFIIFQWNCSWKTLNVSRDLNSCWQLLLKLPEFKCFQFWLKHWKTLKVSLKTQALPLVGCYLQFGFFLIIAHHCWNFQGFHSRLLDPSVWLAKIKLCAHLCFSRCNTLPTWSWLFFFLLTAEVIFYFF